MAPGTYQVSRARGYPHKGAEHGLCCDCFVVAQGLMFLFLFVPVVWDGTVKEIPLVPRRGTQFL